ncbi:MAG: hypothetical protein ACTHOU_01820 [Aureliella sp.]
MKRPLRMSMHFKRLAFETLESRCALAADFATPPSDVAAVGALNVGTIERSDIVVGSTVTIDLLGELGLSSGKITSIHSEGVGELRASGDQKLIYRAPDTLFRSYEHARATVTLVDGDGRTLAATVKLSVRPPADQPYRSSAPVDIRLDAFDSAGRPVSSVAVGDEIVVVATVTDLRPAASGVYSAYFDVQLDSPNLVPVGKAENIAPYLNGVHGKQSASGWMGIGGFSTIQTPLGAEPSQIVKFTVRVTDEGPVRLSLHPSTALGDDVLLFGIDFPIDTSHTPVATLDLLATGQSPIQEDIPAQIDLSDGSAVESDPLDSDPTNSEPTESVPTDKPPHASSPASSATSPVETAPLVVELAGQISPDLWLVAPAALTGQLDSSWQQAAPQVFADAVDRPLDGILIDWLVTKRRLRG